LFPESIFKGHPDFVQYGTVTPKGQSEKKTRIPYADLSAFEKNPEFENIGDLFTVDLIVRYVKSKVG
jgi:hypothetical protein